MTEVPLSTKDQKVVNCSSTSATSLAELKFSNMSNLNNLLEGPTVATAVDKQEPKLKRWKICCVVLVIIVLILIIALIVVATKKHSEESKCVNIPVNRSKKDKVHQGMVSNPKMTSTNPSVFQDLTSKELNNVRDYLLQRKELNLVPFEKAPMVSNIIHSIELFLPPKELVLRHLIQKKPKPTRRAKVVIFNGNMSNPNVREYIVEPLPRPNNYSLHYVAPNVREVSYKHRPINSKEFTAASVFLSGQVKKKPYMSQILLESFGGHFEHPTNRLTLNPGGFGVDATGKRRLSWVGMRRFVECWYLHNLPIEVMVDHTDPDPRRWTIEKVYYNLQLFDSLDELVSKYKANSINKVKMPWPTEEEIVQGSMRKRENFLFESPQFGPSLVEPAGRRYAIKGREITYSAWKLNIGTKIDTGLAVYDVRFRNKRIAYEISPQELASFYSSQDPLQIHAQYFDSFIGLGGLAAQLIRGVDCPQTAEFMDLEVFIDGPAAKTLKNAVCVFEMNQPIPSRRHNDLIGTTFYSYGGHSSYALYVRSVVVAGNYDYIQDYVFYQSGVIEVKTTPTGYISANYIAKSFNDFGYKLYKDTTGAIHDHMILYKVDLDVDGTQNSFQTLSVTPRNFFPQWNKNLTVVRKSIGRHIWRKEQDATIKYDFDKPKYYVFINENSMQKYMYPVGYRLVPRSMVKQVYPDDYYVTKAAAWSKYQISVSKYKETEREASPPYNAFSLGNPTLDFDSFLRDNEDIRNEDLVAWVSVGGLHIPVPEDVPNTITTGGDFGFMLKPFGFFTEDPTVGSREAVLAKLTFKGYVTEDYGMPRTASCPVVNKTFVFPVT